MAGRILQTAFFIVVALLIQYCYLEGSVKAISRPAQSYLYNCGDYVINAQFPSTTEVHLTPDRGEDLLLNIYFTDSEIEYRGYIQFWLLDNLERFLKDSKTKSTYDFVSFSEVKLELNKYTGFHEEWTADFNGNLISAKEYWLLIKEPGEAVRLSFFTDGAEFSEQQKKIINHILNSLSVTRKG
ncbi:MAG: hypothetical protein GX091_02560 [Peptococcaceae bacterium]|nr:hypothetical protein [Peptococcaceae bacterium]